eukprot:3479260-Prymnesium_polylepis.1
MKECVTTVNATWSVCGTSIASGTVPLYLNLPDPTAAHITISESRLTPLGNDASLSPINVQTASALVVVVDFDDGSSRTMSSDSRITYSTSDPSCSSADDGADTLTILASASCTSVMALATVQLGSFRFQVNHTRPVVYMQRLALSFRGYPETDTNTAVAVSAIGLVPCLTSVYFHASAVVVGHLTDASSYTVTSQSIFNSSAPTVVFLASSSSTRMQALSPGTATITATFGLQAATNAELSVQDASLDPPVSLAWTVPSLDANNLEVNATASSQLALIYSSGLRHDDLSSATFDSWIDVETLISFTSTHSGALSVSSSGTLTLHDNYQTAITLTASLACNSILAEASAFANLAAAPMDVDLGSLTGLQFSHAGASYLDIPVHVRPASSTTLKAFQIKLGPLPSALNSAAGSSWTDGGSFSGIATQFDNPSTEVVLSASDTASTVSTQVTLGTVRLNVVGSGVQLIEGEISSFVVQDAAGTNTEVQYSAIVAGRGYVSLIASRRRYLAGEPQTPPAQLRTRQPESGRRQLQTTCDPCTAQ